MTQFLPPNLLALFAPREPIPYLAPLDKLPHEKKPWPYTGVSDFLHEFEVCVTCCGLYSIILGHRTLLTHQHLGRLKHVKNGRRERYA